MDTEPFLDSVSEEIHQHNVMMLHPLMKLMFDGALSREQVAGWARQF